MSWLDEKEIAGDIREARSHFDEGSRAIGASFTAACDMYFRGFNKLWNAHAYTESEPTRADTTAFIGLLRTIPGNRQPSLLKSEALAGLAGLTQPILDHSILKSRGHRPGSVLKPATQREASERHRSLEKALSSYLADPSPEQASRTTRKLAELLFVVRSNIAHGEKAPYGPDREKAARDEQVCCVAFPVLKLVAGLVLDRTG